MIKAADMLIARRADTRARADFATWKMLAKLNGTSSLPAEAQNFLFGFKALLEKMAEPEASEATIHLVYRSYYGEMGGAGTPPDIKAHINGQANGQGNGKAPVADNVTAFKRPAPKPAEDTYQDRKRSRGQAPASGGADLHLPRHRLCRRPLFLALRRPPEPANSP